jgi:hypothetical protein
VTFDPFDDFEARGRSLMRASAWRRDTAGEATATLSPELSHAC